jgi:hypothetical protein
VVLFDSSLLLAVVSTKGLLVMECFCYFLRRVTCELCELERGRGMKRAKNMTRRDYL